MRLVVLLVALLIAGCTGDRVKSDSADKRRTRFRASRKGLTLKNSLYRGRARRNKIVSPGQ